MGLDFPASYTCMADMLFNDVVNYDTNKKILCEKHGVKIFYIKYNDNIEEKLNEILKKK